MTNQSAEVKMLVHLAKQADSVVKHGWNGLSPKQQHALLSLHVMSGKILMDKLAMSIYNSDTTKLAMFVAQHDGLAISRISNASQLYYYSKHLQKVDAELLQSLIRKALDTRQVTKIRLSSAVEKKQRLEQRISQLEKKLKKYD